jgi:hypothetical protein
MTVQELIEELRNFPDYEVVVDFVPSQRVAVEKDHETHEVFIYRGGA